MIVFKIKLASSAINTCYWLNHEKNIAGKYSFKCSDEDEEGFRQAWIFFETIDELLSFIEDAGGRVIIIKDDKTGLEIVVYDDFYE